MSAINNNKKKLNQVHVCLNITCVPSTPHIATAYMIIIELPYFAVSVFVLFFINFGTEHTHTHIALDFISCFLAIQCQRIVSHSTELQRLALIIIIFDVEPEKCTHTHTYADIRIHFMP